MTVRQWLFPVAVAALLWAGSARAAEGVICTRPEILDMVQDVFRARVAHLELVPDAVRETSTAELDVVACAVTARVTTYRPEDPPNYPTILLEPRYFRVRRLGSGFAVDFSPG